VFSCGQVRFAGAGPVVLPVQERGPGRAERPMGRLAGRVFGIGDGRAAGRREGAYHGPVAPRAPVPRAVRLRALAVRRAPHDQPAGPAGRGRVRQRRRRRRRQDVVRGPAGRPARLGRGQDHRHPVRHCPAHHRPRIR